MASITSESGGRKRIQFFDPSGKRRTIRLGKATKPQANAFVAGLDDLVSAASVAASINASTAEWLGE
jgi:hypothetical protein